MRVKELMSTKLHTIGPDDLLDKVFILFNFESIRHLPVIEKGKIIGILSDRDLKKILGPRKKIVQSEGGTQFTINARKVKTLMSRNVTTIGPEEKTTDAAAIMAKKKIGCLPVVKKEQLVGIITATDILKAYVQLSISMEKLIKKFEL